MITRLIYYQNKLNRLYGKNIFIVKEVVHCSHHNYLTVYSVPRHSYVTARCDYFSHDKKKYSKSLTECRLHQIHHQQLRMDKRFGKNVYTVLFCGGKHHQALLLIRHNSPKCGYHINIIRRVLINEIINNNTPCTWCRIHHSHSKNYYRFMIGKKYNGEYTYLGQKTNYYLSHRGSYCCIYLHLRHNNPYCHYNTFWKVDYKCLSPSVHIICPKCADKLGHYKEQHNNNIFLHKLLKCSDYRHCYYIPAEHYKGIYHPILWWHMTLPTPHLFIATPKSFLYKNTRCPYSNASMPERCVLAWLHNHGLYAYKHDFIYRYVFSQGPLQNYHLDFLLKNHVAIEVQGGFHVMGDPRATYPHLQLNKTKIHDMDKIIYTPLYHIHLIHIIAYIWRHHNSLSQPLIPSGDYPQIERKINYQLNEKLLAHHLLNF